MVAWFTAAFKAVYTVVSTAVTVAAGVVCPPLGAVAAGAFALGGQAINQALTTGASVDDQKYQHQLVMKSLAQMNNSFVSMDGTILKTQDMVKNLEIILNQTAEETQEMLEEIQVFLTNNAEENRKMMKEIQTTLKQLASKLDYNFKALQSYIAEHHFKTEHLTKINNVWFYMEKAMAAQDSKSKLNKFKEIYLSSPPLRSLVEFALGLEDIMLNPVVSAMEAHVLKSNDILENYMQVFSHMVVKVLAMEGFYCGLTSADNNTDTCMKDILETIDEAISKFHTHVTSHKIKGQLYWPNVVQQVIDSNLDETNITVMADRVHSQLEGIRTTDVFSIYSWIHTQYEQGDPKFYTSYSTGSDLLGEYRKCTDDITAERWRYLVVARSASFHNISTSQFELEQTAYRTYALTEEFLYTHNNITRTHKDLPDAYMKIQKKEFHTSLKSVQAFVAFNVTPVVRFTNRGYSILRDEDFNVTSSPRVYIGMSWY